MQQIAISQIEVADYSLVANDDTEGAGIAIDAQGCSGLIFCLNVGISGDTLSGSLLWTFKIQKATDSAFTTPVDLTAAELYDNGGTVAAATIVIDDAAEDPALHVRGVILDPNYRYYRVLADATGTHTNGTPYGAICIKQYGTLVA